ncbi:MAG: hypothetical protein F4069_03415 [Rhodothermaceae bacterium]|nr:hypothetical protein [Rhodothermaceae bacterium]MYG68684.1 hypothetical protein [Rhodothermaceae bacterium]MYJ44366.1 hypothetical protein [Rhodothermaceae bacterium]
MEPATLTVQEHLDSEDWEALYPRLLNYARKKANILSFLQVPGGLPLGNTYKDLVQDALTKVFTGDRKWNPNRNPDLYVYLTSVIDSLFSGLLGKADHRYRDPRDPSEIEGSYEADYNDCFEALEMLVRDACADEEDLDNVRQGLEDEMSSGKIAEFFGINVKEVYRLVRKLRRRIYNKIEAHPCNHQWKSSVTKP